MAQKVELAEVPRQEEDSDSKAAKFIDVEVPETDTKKRDFIPRKSFSFEYKSPDGKLYAGTFTCQRLTLGAVGQVGVIKARLNGGEASVSPGVDFMHHMMAYCSQALVDTPKWWVPEDFFDAALLRLVYDHLRSWEDSFR